VELHRFKKAPPLSIGNVDKTEPSSARERKKIKKGIGFGKKSLS
jgi:hypothetical protein